MFPRARFAFLKFSLPSIVFLILIFVVSNSAARAAGPAETFAGVSLSAASPTVPPGGLLQMQVFVTEPKPILKGKQRVQAVATGASLVEAIPGTASPVTGIRDAALFSTGGDVSGVAVTDSSGTQFFFSSPLNTFGQSIDTPVITLAYPVKNTAVAGQAIALNLDPSFSLWLDPNGKQYPVELKSGTMTVGGALSISDVRPGAGVWPAGTVISISGVGFDPNSKVDFGEAKIATQQYLSPNLIEVTLGNAAEIRGQRIRIDNPNNERATYFAYQRTTRIGVSNHPLVASGLPLFPQTTLSLGYFRPVLQGTMFSGLALQNLNAVRVTATFRLYSKTGALLSTKTLAMGTNTRYSRDLVEMFPALKPRNGMSLKVTTSKPIQMFGLLGDDSTGTLLPVPALSAP